MTGIETIRTWTNRDATSARRLPQSLLVLGGGPDGRRAGPGLRPVRGSGHHRPVGRSAGPDRPPTELGRGAPSPGARRRDRSAGGPGGGRAGRRRAPRAPTSSSWTTARPPPATSRCWRSGGPSRSTAWASSRSACRARELPHDGRLRIGDGLWLIGDPAGPELHTHQAHYQGELAVRMARGEAITPDYRALPRATYIEPELASVGLTLEGALAAGLDAFELVADFPTSIKGYSVEADFGHVTLVFDRASRELVGAAMAVPDASAAIHECVLAIKAHVPIDVLAETIHAFPSTSRILNGLFADAARELAGVDGRLARLVDCARRLRHGRRAVGRDGRVLVRGGARLGSGRGGPRRRPRPRRARRHRPSSAPAHATLGRRRADGRADRRAGSAAGSNERRWPTFVKHVSAGHQGWPGAHRRRSSRLRRRWTSRPSGRPRRPSPSWAATESAWLDRHPPRALLCRGAPHVRGAPSTTSRRRLTSRSGSRRRSRSRTTTRCSAPRIWRIGMRHRCRAPSISCPACVAERTSFRPRLSGRTAAAGRRGSRPRSG